MFTKSIEESKWLNTAPAAEGWDRASYRGKKALQSVGCLVAGIIDFFPALALVSADMFTSGKEDDIRIPAQKWTCSAGKSLSNSFKAFLRMFNPEAEFESKKEKGISHSGDGFIPEYTTQKLRKLAMELPTKNDFQAKVTTRALYALSLITSPFVRAGDALIALVAVPLALVTGGKSQSINNIAYRALQVPMYLKDVDEDFTRLFHPQGSGTSSDADKIPKGFGHFLTTPIN